MWRLPTLPVPVRDYQPRRLALLPFYPQFPRRRRPPRPTRHHGVVRVHPALVRDLRCGLRTTAPAALGASRRHVVSGRTLRDHSRSAPVPLAGRRPRRRGHRHPAPASPGSPRRRAVLSQVAQAERPCPAPPRHRSPRELSLGTPDRHAVRRPRHHALREQPGRSLTPADPPARAPYAALQIGGTRPAVPRGPRRRSEPVHHWTTSAPCRPSATSVLARFRCVERRGSGLTRSPSR